MPQPEKWTIRELLTWTKDFFAKKGIESPRLEAEVLLGHATGKSRVDLFVSYDEEPNEETRAAFRELVRRRVAGEPVAYLVGSKEFYSLDFHVDASVLIPRPETEQLVLETIEYFKKKGWQAGFTGVKKRLPFQIGGELTDEPEPEPTPAPVPAPRVSGELLICEVGVGSGCVSAALAKNIAAARIVALDVSPDALETARRNLERLGLDEQVELLESDLFSVVPATLPEEQRFDAIVSNPPYVSEPEYAALEPTVRNYEPRVALVGGPTGAELPIELVAQAADRIKHGGRLSLELSPTTVEPVADALRADSRWTDVEIRKDFDGMNRFVVAIRV